MSSASKNQSDRYPTFDLIRMLLALEVVIAHAWPAINPEVDWPGFIMAVPAFLAVSGFLVLKSYFETRSWTAFVKKRLLRIVPALTISQLLCLLLFGWGFVNNSLLTWISGGLFTPSGFTNAPLWSLAWEELAYAILAILWMIGAYNRPIYIWALLLLSICFSLITTHIPLAPRIQIISFLAPAFFTGNLAYLHREFLLKCGGIIPWILLVFVMCWGATSPAIVQAFAVVWVGMAGKSLLPLRVPDISYGLYIYHYPILLFITNTYGITTPLAASCLLIASLTLVCSASWYLIEKPALRLKPARKNIGHIATENMSNRDKPFKSV
jgi:peptidoglycan/LPS O-acetylase OafA/YrhL